MTNRILQLSFISLLLLTGVSCSQYQKVLKSDDLEYKYEQATKYYEDGEYFKARSLYEELIGLYRGLGKAEEIYYYYAYCHYYLEDYVMAAFYLKNFIRTYPNSKHAEESMFTSAYCYYLNSPGPSLEQTSTHTAIDELQLFANRYPKSPRLAECNDLIDVLRDKLETKAFRNAVLYFHLGEYTASIVSFGNVIKDFPDTHYKEEALFYILKSNYLMAVNSIESKKKERFQATIVAYNVFESYRPAVAELGKEADGSGANKSLAKEADSIFKNAQKQLNNKS
ncbi:MAG: outer membrane protein assembly factor BamD [Flavobacteriales bacterium]|nr:outer membrane protein assembly factor BamD [Flavobacteriales bacterium]